MVQAFRAQPFSTQAPEDIAKKYGGNKKAIQKAITMGLVDPTAGLLAGMFIDRMRAAQAEEMSDKPTIAQQVMGGASLAPVAQPPMAPQAGLGALPAPGMEGVVPPPAPQAPPEGAPMGMAGGGLADLPVPDGMFDEPENGGYGGYGGGGLVAFAEGAEVGAPEDPYAKLFAVTPDMYAAPDLGAAAPVGVRKAPVVKPGPMAGPLANIQALLGAIPPAPKAPDLRAARTEGEAAARMQWEKERPDVGKMVGELQAEANKIRSPEYQKEQRSQDKLMLAMNFFANMAGTSSPYFLQAVGASATASLPGYAAARKASREEYRQAIRDWADAEGIRVKDAEAKFKFIRDAGTDAFGLTKDEYAMAYNLSKDQADRIAQLANTSLSGEYGLEQQRMQSEATLRAAAMRGGGGGGGGGGGDGEGRGATVTANRFSEMQDKLASAAEKLYEARADWLRAGKPRNDDPTRAKAVTAQKYIDAAEMWKERDRAVREANVRGRTSQTVTVPWQ